MKKIIAIVAGGDSSEHDVSLRSAAGIYSWIDKEKYDVYIVEISHEGAIEDIKISKFLATIRTDVPVELKMEDLKLEEPDNAKLDEIFTDLEFKSFAKRVNRT